MKIYCAHDELWELDKFKPHPDNPNEHTREQAEYLAEIMELNGIRNPIKVSKRSGLITAGHLRLEAAKINKYETYPVDLQDYDSDHEEYQDLVADNAISELSKTNLAKVNVDIQKYGPELSIKALGIPDFKVELFDRIDFINKGDENSEWIGMPEFEPGDNYVKLIYHFKSEEHREKYCEKNNIIPTMKMSNQWIIHVEE